MWKSNRNNCPPLYATPRNPDRVSRIDTLVQLAGLLDIKLLDWQYDFLDGFTEIDPSSGYPYYKTGILTVPRQQGKSEIIGGLMMLDRMLNWPTKPQHVLWNAQSLADTVAMFQAKIQPRLEGNQEFFRAAGFNLTLGQLGFARIRCGNGSSVRLVSSGKSAGHGFTAGLVVVDEAWAEVNSEREQALRYTQRSIPDSQYLILSTAGDLSSVYLRAIIDSSRKRVEMGLETRSFYTEYAAADSDDISDPETWRKASPSLGHFLTEETLRQEYEDFRDRGETGEFERGSLNRWVDAIEDPPIPYEVFDRLTQSVPEQAFKGMIYLGVDARPNRDCAHIVASNDQVITVVDSRNGLDWVRPAVERLSAVNHDIAGFCFTRGGVLEKLGEELEEEGFPILWYNLGLARQAAGALYDACIEETVIFHDAQIQRLRSALGDAVQKDSGSAWVWARRLETSDIAPLVAASMAYHSARNEWFEIDNDLFDGSSPWHSSIDDDWGL